jgi:YcxB-like protein
VLFGTGFFSFEMTENKQIEVDYTATAEDYRRVLIWHSWKKQTIILGAVILILIPVYYGLAGASPTAQPPLIIGTFLLIFPLIVLGTFYWGIWRQAAKIEKIFEPAHVVFSERGVESTGETSSSQMDWNRFHKVYETAADFIFFPQHNVFYTIPKRVFRDETEISDFKVLLKEQLAAKAKLKK